MKRSGRFALTFALVTCTLTQVARAGECVNDWPNPDECFPDILCNQYSDYWDLRRAVVHIYGPDIGGTGVLINSGSCHFGEVDCGAPYLLTANHVVSGQIGGEMSPGEIVALETETSFAFGFEAATCNGPTATGAIALNGALVMAHSSQSDLLLLRLSTSLPPELGAYFVGWCDGPVDRAVAISHPCGAPKRIAISELGEVVFAEIVGRDVYDVFWWEDGALASGSSGAPLLDESSGGLRGIFTNTMQAGSESCSNPSGTPAQDRFTAISTILDFLPDFVKEKSSCVDHFDSSEGSPVIGTVEDGSYYGPGTFHEISATEQVWLVDGFYADSGSTITITVTAP
jgi:hypothetical protein